MTVALAMCLTGVSCARTTPTEVGHAFAPKINDGPLDPATARWLESAREGDAEAQHRKAIKIAHGEATIDVLFGTVQDPSTAATYIHSLQVRIAENQGWTIAVQSHGNSLNRGTHEQPLQGITIKVSALRETLWKTRLTQTMVSISADGTISTD